jgi:hypothetical protein
VASIVVAGALANRLGNGGGAWVRLNWVLGLKKLGHDVHFLEQIDSGACVDANGSVCPPAESTNLAFFRKVTKEFGIAGAATLITPRDPLGPPVADGDVLINLGGHLTDRDRIDRFRRKVYVDLDPGYTQVWHTDGLLGDRLTGYDAYYTVGLNVGKAICSLPTGGIPWRPTLPPVVLDLWPETTPPAYWRFTTVASWRGAFGPLEFNGRAFGTKAHQFRKIIDLPTRSGLPFEVALAIHPADAKDKAALVRAGWQVVEPATVADSPDAFRRYVQESAAEASPAQGVYVETRSGWVSDRTACYLAAGKPAVVEETELCHHLPTGDGLLTFRTLSDAVSAAQTVQRDYRRHAIAARSLAEHYFDSDRVLSRILNEID